MIDAVSSIQTTITHNNMLQTTKQILNYTIGQMKSEIDSVNLLRHQGNKAHNVRVENKG